MQQQLPKPKNASQPRAGADSAESMQVSADTAGCGCKVQHSSQLDSQAAAIVKAQYANQPQKGQTVQRACKWVLTV